MLSNGYKPASVNRELACLKYLYNLAIRWKQFFGQNPVSQVEFLEENNEISRILLPEEEARLLEVSSRYLRNIIIMALNTGMRKMEILSLKWEYVDLEGNMITLPQTNTKAKKTRRIPISWALRKALLEQKLMSGGSEFVFPSEESKNGHLSWLKHSFTTACRRAGIQGLRFHDLRHTAATRMIDLDVSVEKVSKILGHSDINLTMRRYAHPEDSLKDAVEKLANFTLTRSNFRSNENQNETNGL
jgi:integrase